MVLAHLFWRWNTISVYSRFESQIFSLWYCNSGLTASAIDAILPHASVVGGTLNYELYLTLYHISTFLPLFLSGPFIIFSIKLKITLQHCWPFLK